MCCVVLCVWCNCPLFVCVYQVLCFRLVSASCWVAFSQGTPPHAHQSRAHPPSGSAALCSQNHQTSKLHVKIHIQDQHRQTHTADPRGRKPRDASSHDGRGAFAFRRIILAKHQKRSQIDCAMCFPFPWTQICTQVRPQGNTVGLRTLAPQHLLHSKVLFCNNKNIQNRHLQSHIYIYI